MTVDPEFIAKLTEARKVAWLEAQHVLDTAATHSRDLSTGERATYEGRLAEIDKIDARLAEMNAAETRTRETEDAFKRLLAQPTVRGYNSPQDSEIVDSLRSMLLENNPRPIDAFGEGRSNYQPGVERRDLLTSGPANFTPVSFYNQITESLVDSSAVLAAGATLLTTATGETIRIPRATALSTAALTAEGAVIAESDPTLGVVALGAFKYGAIIQVSRELIDDSGADLQAYLARETGTALGLALGAHLISGTGTGQPRGVLADATLGVTGPVGTTVSLGAQGTAGMGTDLVNSLYASVAEPYTRSRAAGFLLRNASLAVVRNLKATTGELVGNAYIAQSPAPFYADAYVPAMAANAKSVLFGDWSRYFVRVVNGVRFERSDDFAFNSDLVTFRAIIRADGALIDPSAIKYLANSAT